jgi:PIN domain nuclease of toxin-antitoxin system
VATILGASATSAVNWSEVIQKAGERGIDTSQLALRFSELGVEIVPFDQTQAEEAARLWLGGLRSLSLGDRACLATAERAGATAVTADRAWADLDLPIRITVIR